MKLGLGSVAIQPQMANHVAHESSKWHWNVISFLDGNGSLLVLSASKRKCSLVQTQFSLVSSPWSRSHLDIASFFAHLLFPTQGPSHNSFHSSHPPPSICTLTLNDGFQGAMDGLVELDPTGSGGFQLHDFMSPSPRKNFVQKGRKYPHEMTNHCHGASWQGFFLGGSLLLHAPSKYFHCVHHKFLHLLILFHVLACKAGTSKISPEPPVFSKKKVSGWWNVTLHEAYLSQNPGEERTSGINLKTWSRLQQASRLSS